MIDINTLSQTELKKAYNRYMRLYKTKNKEKIKAYNKAYSKKRKITESKGSLDIFGV